MKLIKKLYRFFFGVSCIVYPACKMTGRDKAEMVQRAHFVSNAFALHGIKIISPVLEENIKADDNVKLVNHDKDKLSGFWKRDKDIIRYEAHVIMLDHAEMKSFGMEREYCLSRGVLWKPTIIVVSQGTPLSVAQFEDDAIFDSVHKAAHYVVQQWGSRWQRYIWRFHMINKSLLRWIFDQLYQWR